MGRIAVLVHDGVDWPALLVPLQVWTVANDLAGTRRAGSPAFVVDLAVVGAGLSLPARAAAAAPAPPVPVASVAADAVWVPAGDSGALEEDATVRAELRRLRDGAEVVVGTGSGCLLLAAAGLLRGVVAVEDDLAAELGRRGADVEVEAEATYVDQGLLLTGPAAAAGEMALHLVARFESTAAAGRAADRVGIAWRPGDGLVLPPRAGEGLF